MSLRTLAGKTITALENPTPVTLTIIGVVVIFIASAPFLFTAYPPLGDYANHISRIHILTNPDNEYFSSSYDISWALVPNLAFDAIAAGVFGGLDANHAGKLYLIFTFSFLLFSVHLLHRSIYGAYSLIPFAVAGFLYNRIFFMGFLGFYFSIALAICFIACWILLSSKPVIVRLLLGAIFSIILAFFHLHAFGLYGFTWGALELWKLYQQRKDFWHAFRRALIDAMQFLPAIMIVAALTLSTETASAFNFYYDPLEKKLRAIWSLTDERNGIFSVLPFIPITILITLAIERKRLPLPANWILSITLLGGLILFMPYYVMTSANADWRIAPFALFLAIAALTPASLSRNWTAAFLGLVFLAVTANAGLLLKHWQEPKRIQSALLSCAAEHISEGARVRHGFFNGGTRYAFRLQTNHAPSLLTIEKSALVPTTFALEFQQPIRFRSEIKRMLDGDRRPIASKPEDLNIDHLLKNFDFFIIFDVGHPEAVDIKQWASRMPIEAKLVCERGRVGVFRLPRADTATD